MPLSDYALTTIATVEDELGITPSSEDARVQRYIHAVSRWLTAPAQMNRTLQYDAAIAENAAGYGDPYMIIDRPPLVGITSIVYDGTTLDATDYEINDAKAGIIYFPKGTTWTAPSAAGTISSMPLPGMERKLYAVTYGGGWWTPQQLVSGAAPSGVDDLPPEIEDACIQLVSIRRGNRGVNRSIQSEKVLSESVTYFDNPVPQDVVDVIASYRRNVLV